MKINQVIPLHHAGNGRKVFLTLWKLVFDFKGKESTYFMVGRGDKIVPHREKRPDAVVVVATFDYKGEKCLVMTSEFRLPIGVRELGFPAGIIDENDYRDQATHREAASRAAVRELKEETGLDLTVTDISPPNLYSSAGMTNESVMFVFGEATGTPSKDNLEEFEDIDTLLISKSEAKSFLQSEGELAHSKTAWPFLWAFSRSDF